MTNSDMLSELVIVMIELGALMLALGLGAFISEEIAPRLKDPIKRIAVWLKLKLRKSTD